MSLRFRFTLALVAALLAPASLAQAAPPGEGSQVPTQGTPGRADGDWTITGELSKIETHMRGFTDLSDSLGSAQKELAADFEAYLADPKNERLASQIEKKMALFGDQVVHDFDHVIADQDQIIGNFKDLKRKLTRFDSSLGERVAEYEVKMEGIRGEVKNAEKDLIGLAVRIKDAQDPAEKKALENEFAKTYRKFKLKNRNVRGYEHNLQNYRVLYKNMQTLNGIFAQLQDKFTDLIQNLESEKEYLLDSIALQQDSVRIKKIMSEGIYSGERAIKNVTEKLAKLYLSVDAFTQVHDRINQGLGRFAETTDTMAKLSQSIDEIGTGGLSLGEGGGPAGGTMDDAVEFFYKQRGKLKD